MKNKSIELIPSLARISATFGIFLFHYRGMSNLQTYHIDFYSLLVFSFLSGYLVNNAKQKPLYWLSNRLLNILIPYWLVMAGVFLTNSFVNYKPITFTKVIVAFLGGNLFIQDPLYVITWYITFVLLLYMYIFLELSINKKNWYLLLIGGGCFFSFVIAAQYYFFSSYIGLRLGQKFRNRPTFSHKINTLTRIVCFEVQKYCYCFFLVHGGVLLFCFHLFPAHNYLIFFLALVSSIFLSVVVFKIATPIQNTILHRLVKWIPTYQQESA